MKILRLLFILSFGFIISCSNESGPDKSELIGLVLDYETKEPVPKAQISTIPASEVILTDDFGRFEMRTPDEGEFSVIARHKEYITAKEMIAASYDYKSNVTILMRKRDTANGTGDYAIISGNITDAETKETIENVSITLEPGTEVTYSDNSGNYNIAVIEFDTYELKFEKSGYKPVKEEQAIDGYINYSLNVEMEREAPPAKEPLFLKNAVRYWNFDNNASELITGGSSVLYNDVVYGNGIADKGVKLEKNAYIKLKETDFKSMPEFSISIWIKHLSYYEYNGGGYLVCGSIKDGFLGILNAIKPLNIKTDDKRYLYFATGARRDADKDYNDIQPVYLDFNYDEVWTHYTLTFKNDILKVFINGEFQSQNEQPIKYSPDTFLLGAHLVDDFYQSVITRVDAVYDELVIYNREMSASEVKQIFEHY